MPAMFRIGMTGRARMRTRLPFARRGGRTLRIAMQRCTERVPEDTGNMEDTGEGDGCGGGLGGGDTGGADTTALASGVYGV